MAIVLMASVAACGGNPTDKQAANNTALDNIATADGTSIDTANPFALGEQQMNENMKSAVGTDVADNWVRKMIAHHQGAVDMSKVVLAQSPSDHVAKMAQMTVAKQTKEIEVLRKLEKNGSPDHTGADLYSAAMTAMQQKMRAASGADLSETYLRKMLEHHRGAIARSEVALHHNVSGAIKDQVKETRDEQKKEVQMIQGMLHRMPTAHPMANSPTS